MSIPLAPILTSVEAQWEGVGPPGGFPIVRVVFQILDPETVDWVQIERSVNGGGYSLIDTVSDENGAPAQWFDRAAQDGTTYAYRLRSFYDDGETIHYSDYSADGGATTILPWADGINGSATTNSVTIRWRDNSQNESGFYIFRDGSLVHTTGPNETSWTDTGLNGSRWYAYKVRAVNAVTSSQDSDTLNIFTADPPNAPSGLVVTPTGTTTMHLSWQDNSDNETSFKIWRSTDGTNFSNVGSVGANVTSYNDSGLTSNTLYYYRISAENNSGGSATIQTVSASTFAAIAQPTNVVMTPCGLAALEITFQDNSELEDGHDIEYSTDGSWPGTALVELAPNQTYYKWTGVGGAGGGVTRYVRIRARQGASYSAYSAVASATTIGTPDTPTGPAVSEYQDTWIRLTWASATGAAGYKIERSLTGTGGWTEVGRVMAGVLYYKAKGLAASTTYYFRIRAYNGAGNGSYTSNVSQTTRATYSFSKFEKLCRSPKKTIIYLIEVNPLKLLNGWTMTAGKTYTYQYAIQDAGINFDAVWENGVALTAVGSTSAVESTAGSWYCDYTGRKVYIHASTGGDPVDFLYMGSCWLYLTTYQVGNTTFNGNQYLPLIPADGIPTVSAENKAFWEGSFSTDMGTLQIINAKFKSGYYLDRRFQGFIWDNRPVRILAGGDDFSYSDFLNLATGTITGSPNCTDFRGTFPLQDARKELMNLELPTQKYTVAEFPLADTSAIDQYRPFGFGAVVNGPAYCIDSTNRVFEFHAGRCYSVDAVSLNGTTLAAGTDYYIDYQRGRITLSRSLTYSSSDKVTVSFTGAVDLAGDAIDRDALMFLYGALNFAGKSLADLNLDSIYETAETMTDSHALLIYKNMTFGKFMRRLEVSSMAFSYQDQLGRIGLRISQATAPTSIVYVPEQYIDDFQITGPGASRFKIVNIDYAEDPLTDKFSLATVTQNVMDWMYGAKASIDLETTLTTESQANTLRASIIALMNKPTVSFTVKKILYAAGVGDLFYLTRKRYYSTQGTASNLLMRITKIEKDASGLCSIEAQEV